MPRLAQMILDGLAFVLIGAGLTAIGVEYGRNLPDPVAHVADRATAWADPTTTGALAPRTERASSPAASPRPRWIVEAANHPAMPGTRAWIDPPRR